MIPPSDLPEALAAQVERALHDGVGHEEAIAALEAHLAEGGPRTPAVLMALAALTYEDAASLVLTRLEDASREALALVEEARRSGGPEAELGRMREVFVDTIERERERVRQLRMRATNPDVVRPTELVQLAHGLLMRGEDRLAAELFRAADDEDQAQDARDAFERDTSGVVRIAK